MLIKWQKVRIGDIGIFAGNGVDKKINEKEKQVRLLNYMDVMHNDFIYDNMSKHFVTASEEKYKKCLVKKGDIFLTPSSETREDIGISAVAMEDSDDLVYSYHVVRFRPIIDMDLKFRAYIFKNKKFLNQASKYCEGSGKRYVCSNKKFASFELEIPIDIKEQELIAANLFSFDNFIHYLQLLIDKKSKIFESTKQELLNGRLKKSKWQKVRIGDIGIFDGNGVDKKINEKEKQVRLLNYMDVMHNDFIYDNMSKHFVTASEKKYKKCLVKKGDIFLTPSSETREDIGVSAVALEDSDDLVYSYHIVRFRPNIDMDMKFRAYLFQNQKFLNQASKYCEGSGKRYICSNKKFASFELEIPLDLNEQAEIGNILYNMESEIKMLEEKLSKYKKIKSGMMEDLLTGKVRLSYE